LENTVDEGDGEESLFGGALLRRPALAVVDEDGDIVAYYPAAVGVAFDLSFADPICFNNPRMTELRPSSCQVHVGNAACAINVRIFDA